MFQEEDVAGHSTPGQEVREVNRLLDHFPFLFILRPQTTLSHEMVPSTIMMGLQP